MPSLSSLDGDVESWQTGEAQTELIHLKKTGPGTENDEEGILDLNQVLQYGLSNGFPQFVSQLTELNELVHGKTIADASVYVSCGNTDGKSAWLGWDILFVEPDVDTVLTEEYTFGSSLNSGRSKGAKFYPIKTDSSGMIPSDLEAVLSGWDEGARGRKPHLMYTIPCGQNPTGSVMPPERYDEIYAICQKHDVIIMEDDPYFGASSGFKTILYEYRADSFTALQFAPYEPDLEVRERNVAEARAKMPPVPSSAAEDDALRVAKVFNEYAGVRSYLSRDVDGRVVRIDTFSKVFGPGMRMGWVSCNSVFMERLMRIGETSTQVPSNLGQAVLASYLSDDHWGITGFIRWQWAVRLEYQAKRDFLLDCLAKYVPKELVTTTPCGGGMFQFLEVAISTHPRFARTPLPSETDAVAVPLDLTSEPRLGAEANPEVPGLGKKSAGEVEYTTNTGELMDELWKYCIDEGGVLLMPAKLFQVVKPGVDQTHRLNFFRATFAGDKDTIEKAMQAFGKAVQDWFNKG
ncbi:hypothetical protein JCM24511_06849 [Saitozyma sp. JCM 24511]|nr:hypothetical protein JCM24511_06849 [Saitozyma sp. JCM 24511]